MCWYLVSHELCDVQRHPKILELWWGTTSVHHQTAFVDCGLLLADHRPCSRTPKGVMSGRKIHKRESSTSSMTARSGLARYPHSKPMEKTSPSSEGKEGFWQISESGCWYKGNFCIAIVISAIAPSRWTKLLCQCPETENSIAFGSAPRREADSQPISQLVKQAVS